MLEIEKRVVHYWARRTKDFSEVREAELHNQISEDWIKEIRQHVSGDAPKRILDVGTGVGYFALLLAKEGHRVTGIDLTPEMIVQAKALAGKYKEQVDYFVMDAMELSFLDESFDVVITRNLTWTLPDVEKAYREWHRVLKPGGILLNFDASYSHALSMEEMGQAEPESPYGHKGMTHELEMENAYITNAMTISRKNRPAWDEKVLKKIGFSNIRTDVDAGKRILKERDLPEAPMFLVRAEKQASGKQ